uniref:protein-glutamine gamma-glutamyltransferase n=1 Tax=Knipowitschia caucasica TaxID=637954 RepID=A0AAV2LWM6_KNICA
MWRSGHRSFLLFLTSVSHNMDCEQQTVLSGDLISDKCQLRFVNFEIHDNHRSHETVGLSSHHLVVRRGWAFRLTLLFHQRVPWSLYSFDLEVQLGDLAERFPVHFSSKCLNPLRWSARVLPENVHTQSVSVHVCSPVISAVASYHLLLHMRSRRHAFSYDLGTFVLLCNPWCKEDPVWMPLEVQLQEYIHNDYGLVFVGTQQSVRQRPWAFGQMEPGVLEACLQLLQKSPQHQSDRQNDYLRRADPVYLSRVICAMVNCNDDLGVLAGKWQGSYTDGVCPTEWTGSAEILHKWVSSNCSPVRYGQCWVFACVLCTVLRVLGIPARVVTVFNAAHDVNANLIIEEFYSNKGEKFNLSKDSIWNFHVWVECWMRREDLGSEFNGWQVVDPTPQEKSEGIYCCGPCPVSAVQNRVLRCAFDASFILASVDADVVRLIVRDGLVVGRSVDRQCVGQLIYTKSIGSNKPQNLTHTYKTNNRSGENTYHNRSTPHYKQSSPVHSAPMRSSPAASGKISEGSVSRLEVSLDVEKTPGVGDSICLCVTVSNGSGHGRLLTEHLSAQLKHYNRSPHESFWQSRRQFQIQPGQVLTLHHRIPSSRFKSLMAHDDIVNAAVVVKDVKNKERVMAVQEFNLCSHQITIEVEGGDSIQMKKEHTVHVSYTNHCNTLLTGAVLSLEGYGLLEGKHETRLTLLQPGEVIESSVSIMASSAGTKVLQGTFSHSHSLGVTARSFHTISVHS